MRFLKALACAISLTLFSFNGFAAGYVTSVDGYDFKQPDAKLSPDGKYLAMALLNEGRRSLVVVETDGFKSVGGVNFGRMQDVGNFHWANDERLVMEILHREEWDNDPKFYGELYTVKYNGKHGDMVYGFRAGEQQVGSKRKRKEAIYGWARIVSLMPNDKENILISSTDMPGGSELFEDRQKRNLVRAADTSKLYSTVHRLNLKTRRMSSSYTRSPEPNTTFIADQSGELVYAYGAAPGTKMKMYRFVDDKWQKMDVGQGESFMPISFSKDLQSMVYLDNSKDESACLYRQNLATKEIEMMHEQCNLDPTQIAMTVDQSSVYAVKTSDFETPYAMLDTSGVESDFFAQIFGMFEGQKVDVSGRSRDGNYWIVKTQSPDQTLGFYLYSRSKNEFSKVL